MMAHVAIRWARADPGGGSIEAPCLDAVVLGAGRARAAGADRARRRRGGGDV